MVRGLWDCQVAAIINVKLGDTDADSYKYEPMTALLASWETIKKYKHGKHFRDQQKCFIVFSISGRNAREGSPGRTLGIESRHGI